MQERYDELKQYFMESIILIKSGNFYEALGEEAYIMNNIFNYKVREFSKTIRSGFPVCVFSKVISKLEELRINHVIVDANEKTVKKYKHNKYSKYLGQNTTVIKKAEK